MPIYTLMVDHGMEFAQFTELEQTLGCKVYFAHPHCAWERGCNENSKRLLRQYIPKSRDIRMITESELRWVEDQLNRQPRKRHGYRTPSELMPHHPLHLNLEFPGLEKRAVSVSKPWKSGAKCVLSGARQRVTLALT